MHRPTNVRARPIYLDHAATTPVDTRVAAAIRACERDCYGNASSIHSAGVRASRAVERARLVISGRIKSEPDEIYFTSGGTESNNLALAGVVLNRLRIGDRPHLIVSEIEHPSVFDTARWLVEQGATLTVIGVDREGFVDPAAIERAIESRTAIVSVIHGSNEVGTIQAIGDIGAICRRRGVLFHADACQSFTRVPIDVARQQIDLLSINAHKLYGPKGVGALFVRRGVKLAPLFHGGGQESGVRSGTVNTPGIAGFAAAVELMSDEEVHSTAALRDRFIAKLTDVIPGSFLNGSPSERLCNHVSLTIPGTSARALLLALSAQAIHVSTGSACASGKTEPSRALLALGLTRDEAIGTLRLTIGRNTRPREIDRVVATLAELVHQQRNASAPDSTPKVAHA